MVAEVDRSAADRFDDAERLLRGLRATRAEVLGAEHPHTLKSASRLAELLERTGRVDEAIALHNETCGAYERTLGANHPVTRATRAACATLENGRPSEAIPRVPL